MFLFSHRPVVAVVFLFAFVFKDLAVEFVDQQVDGGIQVGIAAVGENVLALYMQGDLGFLHELFHRENHMDAGDMIEMADDLVYLPLDVFTQGGGGFDMVSRDIEIPDISSS